MQLTEQHIDSIRAAFTRLNRFASREDMKGFSGDDPIQCISDVYLFLAQGWATTLAELKEAGK